MGTESRRFAEQTAIVTGSASGIGLATAKRFGSEGARVVIADLDRAKAEAAANEVKAAGAADVWTVACDVAREDQVEAAVNGALERFGRLDVVVNNSCLITFKPLS
jgi:NAD(P)-dependent dehydrogenase (short-subunit alcohol dehydrogenase family)